MIRYLFSHKEINAFMKFLRAMKKIKIKKQIIAAVMAFVVGI